MLVLMLGSLGDIAGWRERRIASAPATLEALRAFLAAEDRALGEALADARIAVAVDQAVVRGDAPLGEEAEIAFFPRVSGG